MRKFIYFFLILCNFSFSQSIDFKDKILEKELLNGFNGVLKSRESSSSLDSNKNGKIETSEALNVQEIQLKFDVDSIQTLEDFKYFKNLIALEITPKQWFREFENTLHLDLTNFEELKYLEITSNFIKSISVKNCFNLEYVNVKNFGNNNLDLIELIGCKKIKEFGAIGIVMDNLDLSTFTELENLYLKQVYEKEKERCNLILPEKNKIKLIRLGLENLILIKPIELENLINLKGLIIKDTSLKQINVENLNKLETLDCINNELEIVKINNNSVLHYVHICNNPLKNIEIKGDLPSLISFFVTPNYYDKFKQDYGNFSFFEKVKPLESSWCY